MLRKMGSPQTRRKTMERAIRAQAKSDIKAAKKLRLPWWALVAFGVSSFAACALLDHYGQLNMALPLLDCIGIFGFFIYLKWGLRRQPLFWATILVLAALHALLVWYIPWDGKWVPAIAVAGMLSVDLCLMSWVLAAVEAVLGTEAAHGRSI